MVRAAMTALATSTFSLAKTITTGYGPWAREAGFELVHVDAYHPRYWGARIRGSGIGRSGTPVAGLSTKAR